MRILLVKPGAHDGLLVKHTSKINVYRELDFFALFQYACSFMKTYHKNENITKIKVNLVWLGVVEGDGGWIPSGFFCHLEIALSRPKCC